MSGEGEKEKSDRESTRGRSMRGRTYVREGTVVPEIAFVREAVADEAQFAFLDVLLDGVEEFFFGDLD